MRFTFVSEWPSKDVCLAVIGDPTFSSTTEQRQYNAVFSLIYGVGASVKECQTLKTNDILQISSAKGEVGFQKVRLGISTKRAILLPKGCVDHLSQHLEENVRKSQDLVFQSSVGNKLHRDYIVAELKNRFKSFSEHRDFNIAHLHTAGIAHALETGMRPAVLGQHRGLTTVRQWQALDRFVRQV